MMQHLKSILLALAPLWVLGAACLEYPKNLSQLEYFENLVAGKQPLKVADVLSHELALISSMDGASNKPLESHHQDQTQEPPMEAASRDKLLEEYHSVARDVGVNCFNLSRVSDLLFLISFHANRNQEENSMLEYLRHFTFEHFARCKLNWDRARDATISKMIDSFTRDQLDLLLNTMLAVRFDLPTDEPRQLNKLKTANNLRTLTAGQMEVAIIVYLARAKDLTVDENLRNYSLDWQDFKLISEFHLVPLCDEVCSKLGDLMSLYDNLFNPKLGKSAEAERLVGEDGARLFEWMSKSKICCDVSRSHKRDLGPDSVQANDSKPHLLQSTFLRLSSKNDDSVLSSKIIKLLAKELTYE